MKMAEKILLEKPPFSGASYYYHGVSRVHALEAMKEIAWHEHVETCRQWIEIVKNIAPTVKMCIDESMERKEFETRFNEQIKKEEPK